MLFLASMDFSHKHRIGVIGGSSATKGLLRKAEKLGRIIAENGDILVCGGLGGVMEAAARGAKSAGGITIGILPSSDPGTANPYIDFPIATNIGEARNFIIVNTSDALVAIDGKYGTLTEIAAALRLGRTVAGISTWDIPGVRPFETAQEAMDYIYSVLR